MRIVMTIDKPEDIIEAAHSFLYSVKHDPELTAGGDDLYGYHIGTSGGDVGERIGTYEVFD